jgi:putative flippase GtrA
MLAQFIRFGVVGAGNTLVSAVVFAALAGAGLDGTAAAAIGFAAGAVNGYWWNARWTFAMHGSLTRYGAVQLGGLAPTTACYRALETAGASRVTAYSVTLALVTCTTFLASRRFVFSRVDSPAHRS